MINASTPVRHQRHLLPFANATGTMPRLKLPAPNVQSPLKLHNCCNATTVMLICVKPGIRIGSTAAAISGHRPDRAARPLRSACRTARTRRSECRRADTSNRRSAAIRAAFRRTVARRCRPCSLRGRRHGCGSCQGTASTISIRRSSIGDVVDHQMREIGLPRHRAQRGEFGHGEAHQIPLPATRIGHVIERPPRPAFLGKGARAARDALDPWSGTM